MIAGVSTACLYPKPIEESLYELALNGVSCVELFINTHSELKKSFAYGMANLLKRFDVKCPSVHPFTCEIEPQMFFSDYERRISDMLEYYKFYFRFMNIVGADIFVFHGGKPSSTCDAERYCERYSRLFRLGREFGVTVAIENVSRCKSGSSAFIKEIKNMLGSEFAFVLDTKQALRSNENPISFLDIVGDKISHVHISDSGEMGDCLLIGRGRFNFKQFFEKLSGYNPDCSVILELYRSGFKGISDLISSYNKLTRMTEPYGRELKK
ncbi:sugar phosphate isomerase/epimerase [Ruminococcus sp.]|uniref:sugar phosphate isomerase/epimerase family protein n=1 Tax=Ruminococcus sp. TaxID=41978 RepID=UPI0025FF06ED|nr:sugar phosphate isomerase/epimerase [Ruminococcus sp.]